MDNEDFIEASDSEELEVILAEREAVLHNPTSSSSLQDPSADTPRKRRKVRHFDNDLCVSAHGLVMSAGFLDARDLSMSPTLASSGLPSSSAVSPTGTPPRTTDLSSIDKDADYETISSSDHESHVLLEPAAPISPMIAEHNTWDFPLGGSQDEIDIISQPAQLLTSSSPQASQIQLRHDSIDDHVAPVDGNSRSQRYDTIGTPTSLNPADKEEASTYRSLPLSNKRLSLPPSSPLHDPSLDLDISSRPMTASPTISHPQESHTTNDSEAALVDALHFQMAEDSDNSRRYSLRNRLPWQVNPYAYDKQRYKMQMRNNPDAIVKIVSPRRDHAHQNHGVDAQNRYEEDDFVVPGDNIESQDVFTRRKKRAISNQPSENAEAHAAPRPILPLPELSDDELSSLSNMDAKGTLRPSSSRISDGIRKFPLKVARSRKSLNKYGEGDSDVQLQKPAISYTRIKANHSRLASEPSLSSGKSKESGDNNSTLNHEEINHPDWNNDQDFDIPDPGGPSALPYESNNSVVKAQTRSTQVSTSSSDTEKERSEPSSDAESQLTMGLLQSKQLKVLGRMMPKVMLAKMLGDQSRKTSSKKIQPPLRARRLSYESSEDDDADNLQPGRSRLTRRSGSQNRVQEIRGDSESSEAELAVGSPPNEKSSTDSDTGSASSDHDPLADMDLEGDLGYFDNNYARKEQHRANRKEDLIDRMLSRTSGRVKGTRRRKTQRLGGGPRLDVNIPPSSPRDRPREYRGRDGRQSRLPFSAVKASSNRSSTTHQDVIDVDSPPVSPLRKGTAIIGSEPYGRERPHKMSKKHLKEAVLRSNLFTIPGQGKRVGNGRGKGLLRVQIDMADNGFRDALAPLDRVTKSPAEFNHDHTHLNGFRRPSNTKRISNRLTDPKQTSLHDFSTFSEGDVHDFSSHTPDNFPGINTSVERLGHDEFRRRQTICTMDMEVQLLPLSITFPQTSYIGRQRLYDLTSVVRGDLKPSLPVYSGFGLFNFNEATAAPQLSESLEVASNVFEEWMDDTDVVDADTDIQKHLNLMQVLCLYLTGLYTQQNEEGRSQIQTSTLFCVRRLKNKVRSIVAKSSDLNKKLLWVLWFSVEITSRLVADDQPVAPSSLEEWRDSIILLMQSLISYGLTRTLDTIQREKIDEQTLQTQVAELWVCLLHLLDALEGKQVGLGGIWSFVTQVTENEKRQSGADVEVSESLWHLIFTLNALSQFSVHGNSSSKVHIRANWDIVALALDLIRLTHDQDRDRHRPYNSLKKRDKYVRIVVARCYLLATRWQWSLHDSHVMFKKLVVIFKSRSFGNLIGEGADFPAFLRYLDLSLLHTVRGSDTAFSLFLKLLVLTAKTEALDKEGSERRQQNLMKLLSLTVPLSGVPFSKAQPPTGDELAMLYNRYSSIIVAIYVDPSERNVKARLDRARRYSNFAEADERSRQACIRAIMYVAILLQHLGVPLRELLIWLGDVAEIILEEFKFANTPLQSRLGDPNTEQKLKQDRNSATLSIQLLLGCVRKILETQGMKGEETRKELSYPEVDLLCATWIKKVFALKELTNIATTRHEILLLVQAFLHARSKVIPPPPKPIHSSIAASESQDLYDEFGLDDDVLAALDLGDDFGPLDKNKELDNKVSDVVNNDILPAIFRLVLQYFNDPTATAQNEEILADYWLNADQWIKCWVGCAAVVVQTGKRNWSHYLVVGPQSWAGISDSSFRRRVALHFMYHLLQCDPSAYKDQDRPFLRVLLECFVSSKISLENEYVALLYSIDGLRYPMFQDLPLPAIDDGGDLHLSRANFLEIRMVIFDAMISNLEKNLGKESLSHNKELNFAVLSFLDCVVGMVSAMREIWEGLSSVLRDEKAMYNNLCIEVFGVLSKYPNVGKSSQLSGLVSWGLQFVTQG